jgi:phosphoribosylanthranilate isomerase
MTWVKVCGLTRVADVTAAVEAGADAVGIVLIASSPRFVPREGAAELVAAAGGVRRVVLTIDLAPDELEPLLEETGADGIQPYGAHAAAVAAAATAAGVFVLRPVPVGIGLDLPGPGEGIPLLDAAGPALGGTGRRFDWDLATGIGVRWVLAGGLGPDNVAEAIAVARPWGVDASTGLEEAPGIKDHGRVAAFVREAKRA